MPVILEFRKGRKETSMIYILKLPLSPTHTYMCIYAHKVCAYMYVYVHTNVQKRKKCI